MACGWGGALRRMKEHGNILLTGAEKRSLGILVFDATTALRVHAENGDTGREVPESHSRRKRMWNDEAMRAEMLPVIAKDAGMDVDATQTCHIRDSQTLTTSCPKHGWVARAQPS